MEKSKQARLEAAGWKFGNAEDFLGLSAEEREYLEMKLILSQEIRHRRQQSGLTQEAIAQMAGSSQSRVAKMEAGDPSVSIDLLMKTLIAMGVPRQEIALAIGAQDSA